MSNIPNNGENDQSLRDDLDRLGGAYGQLQHEEPPELLDQAVLSSAHRAVEKKPGWMQFGWLHGLTTAAVFVLALSVIFNQRAQVPVYEDRVRLDDSIGLQRQKAAKKGSMDIETDDSSLELKEENAKRLDSFQEIRVSAPTGDEAVNAVAPDQAPAPVSDVLNNAYKAQGPDARADNADKDILASEPPVEEIRADEAGLMADAPVVEDMREQSRSAVVAAAPVTEAEAPAEKADEIEQQILAIIKMKASGDEAWVTELALFKQNYPDYPLPDELSN